MTQAERDVLDAAIAAVVIEQRGRFEVADISTDAKRVGALVRAVRVLASERAKASYWR